MNIEQHINSFKQKYQNKAPLGMCFFTSDKKYMFDAGTNKVIECGEIEFKIINIIFHNKLDQIYELEKIYGTQIINETLDSIKECINKEHILGVNQFSPIRIDPNYREKIEKGQQQLTLELTEKCNLRCKYCIYHEGFKKDRNFGINSMTEETAFKAIDCFAEHNIEEEEISVTFYGGEPLIEFSLMKKCIEYAKSIFLPKNKRLTISFTTNLVLVTPEIAKYLSEQPYISILGSLDGPEEIHDRYRVDVNGKGSFKKAIKGLQYLVEAFGDRSEECIGINMVYAPPYSLKKLQQIEDFYNELEWLPKGIEKEISSVEFDSLPKEIEEQFAEPYLTDTVFKRAKEKVGSSDFSNEAVKRPFLRIYRLPVLDESSKKIGMNGCCLPGHRRLYVKVDGNFRICERVGNAPYIGNVEKGINTEFIKSEYLDNYANQSYEDCSKCWAARLCGACYSHCYKEGEFSLESKRRQCLGIRGSLWECFCLYYDMLEKNPENLKFLENIKLV